MINAKLLLLVVASVALSSVAQIALKMGMSRGSVQEAQGAGGSFGLILNALAEPFVLGGLACYGFGALLWLFVLAKLDVSMAYPFVGLGFILTMILGAMVLNEQVGALRILGTVLVVAGVVLVAKS